MILRPPRSTRTATLSPHTTLFRSRYEILSDWTENARVLDPKEVNWAAVAAGRRDLRIRQLPGAHNAMGDVKFMFPNDRGIFLHDTPDRALFKDDERRFSSGCVRLEGAGRLGKWLFGQPIRTKSRSEEHTSELQSLMRISYAVFCLKKKKTHEYTSTHTMIITD